MNITDQIRAIADPVIAAGGTPADVNVAVRRELGIELGRGGGGNNWLIPPCPYCGAYGGGGHGGFCPGITGEVRS